jgi:hypothetical protein
VCVCGWMSGRVGVCMCVCACSLYQACKAHAPYYIAICGLSGSTKFFDTTYKRHNFRKRVIEYKLRVQIFSTNLSQIFLILKIIHRDIVINVKTLHLKCPLFLPDFNSADFRKESSNIKFHQNSSSGRTAVPRGRTYGQTVRHDEATSRFSRFCKAA